MGFPPPSATPPPCPGRTIPARPPPPTGSPPPRIERPLQPRSAFSWPASRVFRPRLPEVSDRGGRRRTDARVHVPQRVLPSSPLPRASEERTATKGRGRWQPVRSRDTPLRTGWEPSTHPEGIDAANREQSNAQGHPAPPQKSQLKTQSYEGGAGSTAGKFVTTTTGCLPDRALQPLQPLQLTPWTGNVGSGWASAALATGLEPTRKVGSGPTWADEAMEPPDHFERKRMGSTPDAESRHRGGAKITRSICGGRRNSGSHKI